MKTICKQVCNDCPFGKKSTKGWLGPYSVKEIQDAIQFEYLFGCHKQLGDDPSENRKKIESGEINMCRGFMLSAEKSCKLFGQNPNTGKELRELQDNLNPTKKELENTLSKWEFAKHHN